MKPEEKRTRIGLHWKMEGPHGALISGFQPDGLATKTLDEAENVEETVFISIRNVMMKNESKCMDDEDDRLDLCHQITRWVYINRRKIV